MNEYDRINKFLPLMKSLYSTAKEKLGFQPHVKICIIKSDENMMNPLGKTAHYSPSEHKIALFTKGRHIKDILRSLSHELVHHNQNCRGDFDDGAATVQGYAQEDGHLREMEREAYESGNMIFRDWEDKLKDKGGKPLFTSTSQYVPPPTSDVGGGGMLEEHKMKKKVNESHLRNIIRGVIQEMFDEDLHEGENLGMDEKGEADEEMAQAGAAAATRDKAPYEVGGEGLGEGALGKLAGAAGKAVGGAVKSVGQSALGAAKEKAAELGTQAVEKGAAKVKDTLGKTQEGLAEDLQSTKGHFSDEDPGTVDYGEDEPEGGLDEDSEREETEHYGEDEGEDHKAEESMEDHVAAIDRHLDALKRDMGYDESHEYRDEEGEHFKESYFPVQHDIREKARYELNEGLMKKWGYTKKEK